MQDPLVTAFATANLFIVLPLIQERARQILEEASVPAEDASEAVDVLVPTSFTFPQSAAAVVPTPSLGSVPIAVMVPRGEENLLDLVNAAVEVADADGLLGRKLDYWVHGEGTRAEMGPRWSIARDLLGWWQD